MKKRILAALLAVAMLACSLAACATSDTPSTTAPSTSGGSTADTAKTTEPAPTEKPKETITLKLWGGVQPEYGYQELCDNFNKEFADKGLQVEYTRYVNDDNGNLQLDTYLMGGDQIDIYMGYGGKTRLINRQEAGMAYDMTDYLTSHGFDPVEELGAANVVPYQIDGKYYALPTKYENPNWWLCNADMFKEAGIELPLHGWTYAEFEEACKKLTHGEGQDKVYGMFWNLVKDINGSTNFMPQMIPEYGFYTDETMTATNLNNDVYKKGLQMMVDSFNDGWGTSYEQVVADGLTFDNTFLAGKAAISTTISNMRLVKDTVTYPRDFETAIIPAPVPDESYMDNWDFSTVTGAGDLICVNPKSAHVEEAMAFVLWYIQGGMAPLAKGGRIPLWKGFDPDLVLNSLCEEPGVFNEESVRTYMSIGRDQGLKSYTTSADSKIKAIRKEEMEAAFYGQKTVDQACEDAKTRADELLKK